MARLLPSVAPEVQTISFGSALISAATWLRLLTPPRPSSRSVRAARRVAEELREIRNHLLGNPGIDRGRRRVVEIDGQLHAATFSLFRAEILDRRSGLPLWCATGRQSVTDERYSCIFSFSVAHRSCVMQRLSSWQFSLPAHCVASSGSSTAATMSATVTWTSAAQGCSRRPGPRTLETSEARGAACRRAAPDRKAKCAAAR